MPGEDDVQPRSPWSGPVAGCYTRRHAGGREVAAVVGRDEGASEARNCRTSSRARSSAKLNRLGIRITSRSGGEIQDGQVRDRVASGMTVGEVRSRGGETLAPLSGRSSFSGTTGQQTSLEAVPPWSGYQVVPTICPADPENKGHLRRNRQRISIECNWKMTRRPSPRENASAWKPTGTPARRRC